MYKRRLLHYIFIIVGVGGFLLFLGVILNKNIRFFVTPSQVYAENLTQNKQLRIGGVVRKGSLKQHKDWSVFILEDETMSIDVVYRGILPDLFREDQTVVIEGSFQAESIPDLLTLFLKSKNDLFHARVILAKHDENYKPPSMRKTS